MQQLSLNMLGLIEEAYAVPHEDISRISSYREAVRACWAHRRSQRMTRATLAELTGMYPQHLSDYLDESDVDRHGKERRDMPAKYIAAFEAVTGNTYVSQWLALRSVEAIIEERKAA